MVAPSTVSGVSGKVQMATGMVVKMVAPVSLPSTRSGVSGKVQMATETVAPNSVSGKSSGRF